MALLEGIGIADANVMFFAAGVASGMIVTALALRGRRRAPSASTAARPEAVELRLAGAPLTQHAAVIKAAHAAIDGLPFLAPPRVATLVAMPKRTLAFLQERPDAQQVANELLDALRNNVEAAAEIGDAIVKDTNLNDPAQRQRIAAKVKTIGRRLDASFWERFGDLIAASGFPDSLKANFKAFFGHVRRLKSAVDALPSNPTVADFAPVIERVVDLVETAIAIIEDLKRMS